MKKTAAILCLAAVLLLGGISFAAEAVPSPVTEYETFDEMLQASEVTMAQPEFLGWVDTLTYATIGENPQISQITFQVEGRTYTYRGAKAETPEEAAALRESIHGVYFPGVANEGADVFEAATVEWPEDIAFEFTEGTDKSLLYTWYIPGADGEYSLYSADSYKSGDGEMVTLVQDLIAYTPKG